MNDFEPKAYRSAQGIRAKPDKQKHDASPRIPVKDPTNATGPHKSNQFSLLSPTTFRDTLTSSLNEISEYSSSLISTCIVSCIFCLIVALMSNKLKNDGFDCFDFARL